MDLFQTIRDISYIYFKIPNPAILSRKKVSPFRVTLNVFLHYLKLIFYKLVYGNKNILGSKSAEGKIWVLIASKNNKDALQFCVDQLSQSIFISTYSAPFRKPFPELLRISFHQGLVFLFKSRRVIKSFHTDYACEAILQNLDILHEAGTYYLGGLRILLKGQPKAIIFANDHSPKARAILMAARSLNIPTIYIQHASVSHYFPPLKHSLALLEGKDSLNKYKACGPVESTVHLIGMPKFDPYLKFRKSSNREIQNIGVAVNELNDINSINNLLLFLSTHFKTYTITLRPHPRESRQIYPPEQVQLSNAKEENIFEFLTKQDIMIASNTSTHLEATLLNIYSIYYEIGRTDTPDYYGFVASGMIDYASDLETLKMMMLNYLEKPLDVFQRAKPFNETIGTQWEGNSRKLAIEKIKTYLQSI